MLNQLHGFADSGSGLSALGLSGSSFLIQLITFLIVFFLLKRYAFKPILKVLERRRKVIEQGISLGEKMQKEQADFEKKVSDELHKAREEADNLVSVAHQEAKQVMQEAEENAHKKGDAIIAEAEAKITSETNAAKKRLQSELVGLVAEATEAVLEEKVDARKDAELISKALKERQLT